MRIIGHKGKNIFLMEIWEGEDKGTESIFKATMAENFPNLGREMYIQTHETQKILNRLNPNRVTLRCIIIKLPKAKERKNFNNYEKRETL